MAEKFTHGQKIVYSSLKAELEGIYVSQDVKVDSCTGRLHIIRVKRNSIMGGKPVWQLLAVEAAKIRAA